MRACVSGLFVACALSLCVTGAARAAGAAWSAPACGREPVAPPVDSSTVARYNASIDSVTAYEKAARTYNGCVAAAASREESAISAEARTRIAHVHEASVAVHQRIADNFSRLTAQLKAGAARYSH
ncbi:hypothetical protein HLH34_07730 [Gluconacetobacter azotocaptans]|uniref:UrcA family protein n=1 Tax=Gluconacetobacter azotocaptans TaxID=142834 RepID=A0A7W4PGC2_9PROT|nr:hypothetical protein [Gluconacetobacter azotocaptans]MBB2189856.1 hypothetical protein [Gluconacetobacter azotocaptans]MBM9402683.1 hypothetical protein [Gluconacetobacter azotocaptans]